MWNRIVNFHATFTYRETEWDQLEDSLDGEQQREHQIESAEHIGEGQRGTMELKLSQNLFERKI